MGDLATAVATLDSDTEVTDTAVDTPPLDTPDLATAVATLDSDTEVTDTPVATTEDSATDTAVATDTLDKKVPALQSAKAFKTSAKQNNYSWMPELAVSVLSDS